jgi:DNA-directed RNA polymerase specialized sigma24 family protein
MALEDPDLALVQALQAGDNRALNTLIERHHERLYRFLFRHISNEADAIELTQKTSFALISTSKNFGRTPSS